jgi:hypothetical protein
MIAMVVAISRMFYLPLVPVRQSRNQSRDRKRAVKRPEGGSRSQNQNLERTLAEKALEECINSVLVSTGKNSHVRGERK